MKRAFSMKYGNIAAVKPHLLRAVYSELTLDASVTQSVAIDNRLQQAILNDDPELIIDLRSLNKGRPDNIFSVFFNQLEKEVDSLMVSHLYFFATLNKEQNSSYLQLSRRLNGKMLVLRFLYSKSTPIVQQKNAKKPACQTIAFFAKY